MKLGAKGFGSKNTSSGAPTSSTSNKALLKRLTKKYGGTTTQEIAKGTQNLIDQAILELPPHVQMATKLYQQLRQWNARLETMTILQQASIPAFEMDGAQRAQRELDQIYREFNLSDNDLHNVFQQITWDASADAKAARSVVGSMSADIKIRVNRACEYIAKAMRTPEARCLDVGCGFGTMVPLLTRQTTPLSSSSSSRGAMVIPRQIYGVDLSPEMIRNARKLFPDSNFCATDFLQYQGPLDDAVGMASGFDGVLFCSALHDMPDPWAALSHASSLLRPDGVLVVVHASGAGHVRQQSLANPVLVRRELPTGPELREWASQYQLRLVVEPALANTPKDFDQGYLVVFEKESS